MFWKRNPSPADFSSYAENFVGLDEGRVKKAEKLSPSSIDRQAGTAEFVSDTSGEVYKTSLKSCTCRDFRSNKSACKHMIRLAMLLDVPVTYERLVKTYIRTVYGFEDEIPSAPVPPEKTEASPSKTSKSGDAPAPKEYSIDELVPILQRKGIVMEDNRSVGGCLWIENTKEHEAFLSSVKVDGKKMPHTSPPKHFKWQYAWYVK